MTRCKYAGRNEPRIVPGEHYDECQGGCDGCWPCPERHCSTCGFRHTDNAHPVTCPDCVGDAREDLGLLGKFAGDMMGEAMHRGVDSEAAMLAGPAADVETWQRRQRLLVNAALAVDDERSDEAKRLKAWIEDCRDEQHPLWVLGTWDMLWREHLDHPTDQRLTVETAVAYLGGQLTYMAQQDEPEFGDFAREVRQCRSYLEDVLRDGEREERGVPCPECVKRGDKAPALVKEYDRRDTTGAGDKWRCHRCKSWWSEADYRLRVGSDHLRHAEELTATDLVSRTRVPASTIRRWASTTKKRVNGETVEVPPLLRSSGRSHDGRLLYRVADVIALRDAEPQRVA